MFSDCNRKHILTQAALTLMCLTLSGAALAQAGKVIFVAGQVQVERGVSAPLRKGDDVEVGDVVVTGDRSRAQLLMADGARIAMRPNSRLRIDEFVYPAAPATATPAAVTSAPGQRSVTTLIKGGFRTITGAIGRNDETEYEVRTPVGTLGIRGTDYTAVWCAGDCITAPGVAGAGPLPDGLYLGVSAGIIFFRNSVRTLELHAGQYAYIPAADAEPEQLLAPPAVFFATPDADYQRPPTSGQRQPGRPDDDGSRPGAGEDQTTPDGSSFQEGVSERASPAYRSQPQPSTYDKSQFGFTSPPAQVILATDPSGNVVDLTDGTAPPQPITVFVSFFDENRSGGFVGGADNLPGEILTDNQGNPIQFRGTFLDVSAGLVGATYNIGTAVNVESGFDPVTQLRWGRWSGGIATVLPDNASVPQSIDLFANDSLHWIDGADRLNPPAIPQTGQASYALIGSTSPTDNLGNVGTVGSATFDADFTNQMVSSMVDLTIGGTQWIATGVGNIGGAAQSAHHFSGLYGTVLVGGVPSGAGSFSGFFTGPVSGGSGIPAGAGLTYSLSDPAFGAVISGALAFGN